jgi:hypothetical protein
MVSAHQCDSDEAGRIAKTANPDKAGGMNESSDQKLIRKLHASHSDRWVVVRWEHTGPTPGEVIVVRSDVGYAESLEELFVEHPKQRAVYFDTGTCSQDQDVMGDVTYYYTAFAQAPDGSWHRQGKERVHTKEVLPEYERVEFFEDGTLMKKVDTLRVGLFAGGGFGMGGT